MIIHDRTRLTGWLILFFIISFTQPVYAYGPTDEEVFSNAVDLDLTYLPVFPAGNAQEAARAGRRSAVYIHAGYENGSGSILHIDRDGLIVMSNRHVLEGWVDFDERFTVTLYDGTVLTGELLGLSDACDAGFLHLQPEQTDYEQLLRLRSVRLGKEEDDCTGKSVFAFAFDRDKLLLHTVSYPGNDTGVAEQVHEGEVLSSEAYIRYFQRNMRYVACHAEPGMSGGALFDTGLQYRGMVTAANDDGDMVCVLPADLLAAAEEIVYHK